MTAHITHPGPLQTNRIESVQGTSTTIIERLPGGGRLVDELHQLLASHGHRFGIAELMDGTLDPVCYCVPADGRNGQSVSYSETRQAGRSTLVFGSAVLGQRNGQPFMHCHCIWRLPDGSLAAGHLWPETLTGHPAPLVALVALDGIQLTSSDCAETFLPVFSPHPGDGEPPMKSETPHPGSRTVVARVMPNEDITGSVTRICNENNFRAAIVRGGTGSLVGAVFEGNDGGPLRTVDGPATEVVTLIGHLMPSADGTSTVQLSCSLVDKHGTVHAGRLVPGENPVSVTFELVVQEINE